MRGSENWWDLRMGSWSLMWSGGRMGGRGGPVRNGDGGRPKNVDLGSVVQRLQKICCLYMAQLGCGLEVD